MDRFHMRLFALAAVLFLGLASCAQNPVTGGRDFVLMSEAQELRLGAQADQQIKKEYSLYSGKAGEQGLQAYVDGIGQKLAKHSHRPELQYRFTVLDSAEINAFALPGGYIYVTRGIMAFLNSEAELAAVVGHEIGHVTARHSVRQASAAQGTDMALNVLSVFAPTLRGSGVQNLVSLFGNALIAGYGREHELEADRLGAEYLARAGYDPDAMIRVIGVLKNQELFDAEVAKQEGREPRAYHGLFATHPDNDRRLHEVVGAAKHYRVGNVSDSRDVFLARSNGMVFGDNPHEGVVREGSFYHSDLAFAFRLPEGWRAQNRPDRLIMMPASADAQLVMTLNKRANESPAETLRRVTQGRARDIDPSPVGGLPAAVSSESGGFAAVIHYRDATYVFGGAFKSQEAYRKHVQAMRESVRTFHPMTDADKAKARALTIKLVKADQSTRFAQLAKASPLGRHAEGYLRLMNGFYPHGEPAPGQMLKVVE
jgi:predicted Zn-dependent protease